VRVLTVQNVKQSQETHQRESQQRSGLSLQFSVCDSLLYYQVLQPNVVHVKLWEIHKKIGGKPGVQRPRGRHMPRREYNIVTDMLKASLGGRQMGAF
jgi:hypothetical protein